ncbi:hypothetical protein HMPREF1546_03306 [Oscillibacter sp. KLE 1745]|nr:hypothetical protein HMPREF1546_03306 [Oscillibacter sp. KLE 1745]
MASASLSTTHNTTEKETARAYSYCYQKFKKELPAAALSLCIPYQSLTWGRPVFTHSVACFSSASSKE